MKELEAFKEVLRTIPCGTNDGNKEFYKNVNLVSKALTPPTSEEEGRRNENKG